MADADYTNEKWLPVAGHEGQYMVSDHGRVKSLPRKVWNGRSWAKHSGRIMKTGNGNHYPKVVLRDGDSGQKVYVHELVLAHFIGTCPPGHVARHLDDNKENNHLSNLAWGSESENAYDKVRNGNDHYAKRGTCKWGHEFTPENIKRNPRYPGTRYCKECIRENDRKRRDRRAEYKREWRANRCTRANQGPSRGQV